MTTGSRKSVKSPVLSHAPAYGLAEAARYVRIAVATLRSWTVGRDYPVEGGTAFFKPLIAPADSAANLLSFANLVEAHVLQALRVEHTVSIRSVRSAMDFSESKLGVKRLLLSEQLRTSHRQLFLKEYGRLINLTQSGQYALETVLEGYLARVEWKASEPLRFFPFIGPQEMGGETPIVIDPGIAFGRPVLRSRGVSTAVIIDRIDAGETVSDLARDYDLSEDEIRTAIVYECAA